MIKELLFKSLQNFLNDSLKGLWMTSVITTIDPREVDCFGFEYFPGERNGNEAASLELIATILFGIENKDNIPPVNMFYLQYPDRYEIAAPWYQGGHSDGGHHRLFAYFSGGHPMPVRLFSEDDWSEGHPIPEENKTHVIDMQIKSDRERFKRALALNGNKYRIPSVLKEPFKTPNPRQVFELLETIKQRPITSSEILRLYQ